MRSNGDINNSGIEHIAKCENLKRLVLTSHDDITGDCLKMMENLHYLTYLDLSSCENIHHNFYHIVNLNKLEELRVQSTSITDVDIEYLVNCPELKKLVLYECPYVTLTGIQRLHTLLPNAEIVVEDEKSPSFFKKYWPL